VVCRPNRWARRLGPVAQSQSPHSRCIGTLCRQIPGDRIFAHRRQRACTTSSGRLRHRGRTTSLLPVEVGSTPRRDHARLTRPSPV